MKERYDMGYYEYVGGISFINTENFESEVADDIKDSTKTNFIVRLA